jgi:hypothetical protein
MKCSKTLLLVSAAVLGVSIVAVAGYQPFSLAQAAAGTLTPASSIYHPSFTSAYRISKPSSKTGFTDAAIANTQAIIAYNQTNPLPTFQIWNGNEPHTIQATAVTFEGWTVIYGSNNLNHDFRIQMITTTEPEYTPFGFFMGIHGVRKIVFQTIGMSYWNGNQGQLTMAICVASLDGTAVYNMEDNAKGAQIEISTEGNYSTYTMTLPDDAATSFTPRWLYIAGSFLSHNLGKDAGTTGQDLNTYYCDLVDFTAYFDATC